MQIAYRWRKIKKELILGALGVFMLFSSCNTKDHKVKTESCLRLNFKRGTFLFRPSPRQKYERVHRISTQCSTKG